MNYSSRNFCAVAAALLLAAALSAVTTPAHAQGMVMDPCLSNPAAANCTNYTLPAANATADVMSLCMMMPWMSVCTQRAQCMMAGVPGGQTNGTFCTTAALLASGCNDMPGMMGCTRNWNRMCGTRLAPITTAVAECNQDLLPYPLTMMAPGVMAVICNTYPNLAACPTYAANCSSTSNNATQLANCRMLETYSALCEEWPATGMSQCADYREMCTYKIKDWPICAGYVPVNPTTGVAPPPATTTGAATTGAASTTGSDEKSDATSVTFAAAALAGAVAALSVL